MGKSGTKEPEREKCQLPIVAQTTTRRSLRGKSENDEFQVSLVQGE